ncbi:MAG: hypothetical protein ACK4VZ_13755 [Paracoccaceae bacterium]
MANFKEYGFAQFAIGRAAQFRGQVSLALDIVAKVQNWTLANDVKSKAELLAAIDRELILQKVPATTATRFRKVISGLCIQMGRDYAGTLTAIKESTDDAEKAVAVMVAAMEVDGIVTLGYLEAYAVKGKPGLAAAKAEAEAKIAAQEAKAAMTEAEATEAAATEAAEAAQAAADLTPRAKAAKQAATILGAIAKHGQLMSGEELTAIAQAIVDLQTARLSVADDKRAADIAADLSAKRAA